MTDRHPAGRVAAEGLIGLAVRSVRDVRALDPSGEAGDEAGGGPLVTLDAVALCARHLLSADERTP